MIGKCVESIESDGIIEKSPSAWGSCSSIHGKNFGPWSFGDTSEEKNIGTSDIRQVQPFLAPKRDRNEIKTKYGF